MKVRMTLLTALILALSLPAGAQDARPNRDEQAGNAAVAERLAQMAQLNLAARTIAPPTLRMSAALLEQATQLAPDEARFLRLLTEAYLQLGGPEGRAGAISALERYRKIEPRDQSAQIRLIDLHFSGMDKADDARKYVDQLLAAESISPEVRSHVAVLGARLAMERSEIEHANSLIAQALELFPLSPQALKMKYQQMPEDAPPAERAALLLQMLRSNPGQPGAMSELASLLARVGLVDLSLSWYQQAFGVSERLGLRPDPRQVNAYLSEMVIADQLQAADGFIGKLLEADPANTDAALLAELIARRSGDAARVEAAAEKSRAALQIRLGQLSDVIQGRTPDPANPSAVSASDIPADVKKIQESGNADMANAYAVLLADLAWREIYFSNKPEAAAPHIDALKELLPADHPTLARLEGWSYLVAGRNDEAKVKLSAVSDRDPLAALGMLRINADQLSPEQNREAASKLLTENASGLVGALLIEALRDRVGLMPLTDVGRSVRDELDKFPREWLDILDMTKVRDFYAIKAQPLKVGHEYGEPILTRVTITNLGRHDLTIGPEGALRPDLWFDVQVKLMAQQHLPGVAFDRLGQRLVLRPKESATQVLRVDQGRLAAWLASNPTVQVPLYFSVLTNPMTLQTGIAPGPCGYRVQFTNVVARASAPANQQTMQNAIERLLRASADERIRNLELLSAFASAMRAQEDQQFAGKAQELADVVRKSTGDRVPAVRTMATYLTAKLSDAPVREGIIRQMLADRSELMRVMGLLTLQESVEPEKFKEQARPLAESDEDPIVKLLASSMIEVADLPPPAEQPAEELTAPEVNPG